MSSRGVERFVELINLSKELAELYAKSPEKALEGFDLSDDEIKALVSRDDDLLKKIKLGYKEVPNLFHRRY